MREFIYTFGSKKVRVFREQEIRIDCITYRITRRVKGNPQTWELTPISWPMHFEQPPSITKTEDEILAAHEHNKKVMAAKKAAWDLSTMGSLISTYYQPVCIGHSARVDAN